MLNVDTMKPRPRPQPRKLEPEPAMTLPQQRQPYKQPQQQPTFSTSMYSSRPTRRSSSAAAAISSASSYSGVSPSASLPQTPARGFTRASTTMGSVSSSTTANASLRTANTMNNQRYHHQRRRSRSQTRADGRASLKSTTPRRAASLQPPVRTSFQTNRMFSSPSVFDYPGHEQASFSTSTTPRRNGNFQYTSTSLNSHVSSYPNPTTHVHPHILSSYSVAVPSSPAFAPEGSILSDIEEGGGARGQGGGGGGTNANTVGSAPGSVHSAPTASSTSRGRGGGGGGRYSLTPRGSDRDRTKRHSLILRSDEEKLHTKICRRVMEDLNRAQGSERRIAALTHVCECCDHKDEGKHNIELGLGMLNVLAKCLNVAVYDDEVRMIGSALEMVLRASPQDVQVAYLKLNFAPVHLHHSHTTPPSPPTQHQQHSFLVNLFRILERCESNSLKHAEVSILNIIKIIFYLSRCPELRTTLCRQTIVLDSLERVGRSVHGSIIANGVNTNTFFLHVNQAAEVRYFRMRTLANLANVDENKVLLLEYQEGALLESILRVSHWDPDDSCRQYAASTLMDLASAPSNQITMASNEKVLGTLVKMTLVEKNALTREFVITALQNLAYCKENRVRLVNFKDGVLLEALKQALSNDLDAKARRRAAGALTNLVCDETAERMGQHKGLLDTLAIVATKDDNWDVQTRASLALTKIANCITIHMDCHNTLLDALVVASLSKANNSVSAVLRVKARNPENREVMARHPGIIDTMTDLCLSVGAAKMNDRDNAIRALMHLTNENKNRKILCTKSVLDALVAGANYTEPELEEARDSAIRAMERLATEHTNRDAMARHPGLITAVARAVEREAGWEDSGREAPENGFLAKPLLMSLLVAM